MSLQLKKLCEFLHTAEDGVAYSRELAKRVDPELDFAFCKDQLREGWIWEPLLNPGHRVDGTGAVETIEVSQSAGETFQIISAYNL